VGLSVHVDKQPVDEGLETCSHETWQGALVDAGVLRAYARDVVGAAMGVCGVAREQSALHFVGVAATAKRPARIGVEPLDEAIAEDDEGWGHWFTQNTSGEAPGLP